MKTIKDRLFICEVVRFDGHSFIACSFEDCTIQYGGGACEWHDCRFSDCRIMLDGGAENSVRVLEALGIQLILPARAGIASSARKN